MKHDELLVQKTQEHDRGQVLLVDIGGGMGHQSRGLRAWLPTECNERLVLQDLPPVLAKAGEIEGIEMMPYDFFTPQPVKGQHHMHHHDQKAYLALRCKVLLP